MFFHAVKSRSWSIAVLLLIALPIVGRAQAPAQTKPLADASHKRVQPEEALTGTTMRMFGDSSQAGYYVIYNRFGPGQGSRPHYHDRDRFVTVIEGTWWTGEGDVYQPDKMIPIKTGGFMFHPAGFHHYDGAKDEEVVVEIVGMGPVQTVQTEVDEEGQPVTGRGEGGSGRGCAGGRGGAGSATPGR